MTVPETVPLDLERSCRQIIRAGVGVVLLGSAGVASRVPPLRAAAFLTTSLVAWLIAADTLWKARGRSWRSLGLATHVTLARGLLVSLVAGFAFVPPIGVVRWLPAALYTAAAIGDRVDGIVARRLGQVTVLGAHLDGAIDALGLCAGPLVGVAWGRLPPWYLLVGAAYYLYLAGIWWRRRRGLPAYPERVTPKPATRFFAGAQMVLVSAALYPVLDPALTAAAATALMIPTLVLFVRDWLIVIGWRPPPGAPAALG